ncbi:hypothetical protein GCM10010505_45200 [Kitasatospora aburaviensis]
MCESSSMKTVRPVAFTTAYAPSAGAKRSTAAENRPCRSAPPDRSARSSGSALDGSVLDVLDAVVIALDSPPPLVIGATTNGRPPGEPTAPGSGGTRQPSVPGSPKE